MRWLLSRLYLSCCHWDLCKSWIAYENPGRSSRCYLFVCFCLNLISLFIPCSVFGNFSYFSADRDGLVWLHHSKVQGGDQYVIGNSVSIWMGDRQGRLSAVNVRRCGPTGHIAGIVNQSIDCITHSPTVTLFEHNLLLFLKYMQRYFPCTY